MYPLFTAACNHLVELSPDYLLHTGGRVAQNSRIRSAVRDM
jgi:hypothetical protein